MIRSITSSMLVCGMLCASPALAQEDAPGDEAVHAELRAIREALTEAITAGDVDGQLKYVHPNVVATWQNHRVVRGVDGLRTFMQEMNAKNEEVFQGYAVPPEADELTILYGGDTGVVFGKSVPRYHYLNMDIELENRWTATLVKEDDGWKIAAYHVSGNLVDNPLLHAAAKSTTWIGGVCLVVGLIVGGLLAGMLKKKRPPATEAA